MRLRALCVIMSSRVAPSFLHYLQTTCPDLHETLVTAERNFDKQERTDFEILFNSCYGGYGFSEEFTQEFNNEHGTSYASYNFDNEVNRHDPKLIKTYKRLFKPYNSEDDTKHNEQWNGSCAKVGIITIKSDSYIIDEYEGHEWIVTPESALSMSWIKIDF